MKHHWRQKWQNQSYPALAPSWEGRALWKRQIMLGKTEGSRERGRANRRWIDSKKEATGLWELSRARQCEDQTLWTSLIRSSPGLRAVQLQVMHTVNLILFVCLFVCFYHFVFLGLLKAIFFCNHILLDYGVFNYSAYKITSGLRYRTNTPSKHIAQLAGAFAEQWSSLCVGPGVLQREWGMLVYRMTVETV